MAANIFTFTGLVNYVSKYINTYETEQILAKGMNAEEYRNAVLKKDKFAENNKECVYGDYNAKEFVKLFIKQLITEGYKDHYIQVEDYPKHYIVNEKNIHNFINLTNIHTMDFHDAFKVILHKWKKKHGNKALKELIEHYELNKPRLDEYGEEMFFVSKEDIARIYKEESIRLNYQDYLDILVQSVYEKYKGLGVVDELFDMDIIDEVSLGVSGIPNDIVSINGAKELNELPKAYDSIWIVYRGIPIQFKFMTLGSWEELQRVIDLLISYEQAHQLSQKEGFILGFRKNGSRVTAARSPFGECNAVWVRNFHVQDVKFEDLVKGLNGEAIGNWDYPCTVADLLMKGCVTTSLNGGQGVGKTTALVSLSEYIYSYYKLRIIEAVFEMAFRKRFPGRDIYTMQSTDHLDETDAYNFSLRTSGDVIIAGEARDDSMIAQITKTGNRGGKFTLLSFHPNSPDICPLEMANALLRQQVYSSMEEAILAVLKTLRCCIQISKDEKYGTRYYNVYEFTPHEIELPKDFMQLKGRNRMEEFMNTFYYYMLNNTSKKLYNTVPIIVFNKVKRKYEMLNTVSDSLYSHMLLNMQGEANINRLEKVFRPEKYLARKIQENQLPADEDAIRRIVKVDDMMLYTDIDNIVKMTMEEMIKCSQF